MDDILTETADGMYVEGDWVHIAERLSVDGDMDLVITHEDGMATYHIIGFLQSALKYYEAMQTNLFFASDCPHCTWEVTTDEGETSDGD